MIRSLYTKTVFIFTGIIIASVFTSFAIHYYSFKEDVKNQYFEKLYLIQSTLKNIESVTEPSSIDLILKEMATLNKAQIDIYENNSHKTIGNLQIWKSPSSLTSTNIEGILQNHEFYKEYHSNLISCNALLAFPFLYKGNMAVLSVQLDTVDEQLAIYQYFVTLASILIIGSIFIGVTSHYIIKPIQVVTRATKELAKGNYHIRLSLNQKDEIGVLANSFNEMANQLNQVEKSRQEFVSNVSHEIQSPLTSIKGFSQILLNNQIPEAEKEKCLQFIFIESNRLSKLGEQLLKLSSLESEKHPYTPSFYELDEQIRKTIISLEPQWNEKRIHLHLQLPKTIIFADQDLLAQVWMNVITNSIKFTPENGSISITLNSNDKHIQIAIQDSGVGISKEDIPFIFQRFYQADRSRDRNQKGNGLGLSIVKKIVEIHEGTITVKSDPLKGTCFIITFNK